MSEGWLRRLRTSGVGFAFALGLLSAGLFHLPYQSSAQQQAVTSSAPKLPAGAASLQDLSEAFASVAEHVKPSVVYIRSGHKAETTRRGGPETRPRMQVPPGFEPFFRGLPPTQEEPRPEPWIGLSPETVVGHVHFTVSRLEPAVAFYRDVIGFKVMMSIPSLVAVSAGGYHHHLNLNTWAGEGAARDSDRVAGLAGWELRVPDGDARKALIERATAAGALAASSNGVTARDPDGVAVKIAGSG